MKSIEVAVLAALLAICVPLAAAKAETASATLSITVTAPLNVVFTPASPITVACSAPAGTLVDTLSTTGGNGKPVTFTMVTLVLSVNGQVLVMPPAPTTTFGLTVPCGLPAGSYIASLVAVGGDGKVLTYKIAKPTGDFVIAGSNLVVGANGITHCGSSQTLKITASQP